MRPVPLGLVGPHARAVLRRNRRGTVYSSHATGLYCRFADAEIVLLHDAAYGLIPFGLGGDASSLRGWRDFPPGTVVSHHAETATILLGATAYSYAGAQTPPPLLPGVPPEYRTAGHLRAGIKTSLALLGKGGIAAAYMARRDSLFGPDARPGPFADMWEEALWNPVRNLAAFCAGDDAGQPETVTAAILGLGPGLTPLGDDILCGLLAGGHALRPFFPGPAMERIVNELSLPVSRLAHGATTMHSAAFLRGAARGETFGMLDAALTALVTGTAQSMENSFAALLGVGHSTGSGLLLGALLAAELAVQ